MTAADERDKRNKAIVQQACWTALAELDAHKPDKAESVLLKAWTAVAGDLEKEIVTLRKALDGMTTKLRLARSRGRASAKPAVAKEKGKSHAVDGKARADAVQGRREGTGKGA